MWTFYEVNSNWKFIKFNSNWSSASAMNLRETEESDQASSQKDRWCDCLGAH